MATAVRLAKLDSDGVVITNINFERYEIMKSRVIPKTKSVVAKSQGGKKTLFILENEHMVIEIQIRIYGTATETKLTELRSFIMAGGIVRVYPRYITAPSVYNDCFIEPDNIPLSFGFSGESNAGEKVKLLFHETDQDSQYVVSEDIVIE